MALSITQTPALVSLAQSPMPFTVAESNAQLLTSASFQYIGDLYYWTGSQFQSSSASDYTIVKYANSSGVGIFDVSHKDNKTIVKNITDNCDIFCKKMTEKIEEVCDSFFGFTEKNDNEW